MWSSDESYYFEDKCMSIFTALQAFLSQIHHFCDGEVCSLDGIFSCSLLAYFDHLWKKLGLISWTASDNENDVTKLLLR